MENVALIALEDGSEWPGHVGESTNIVVLVQNDCAFVDRLQHRIEALQRGGQRVRVALLACNDATDRHACEHRRIVASVLLAAVVRSGFGRLVLTARGTSTSPRGLLTLADTLRSSLDGTRATVFLRVTGKKRDRAAVRREGDQRTVRAFEWQERPRRVGRLANP